MSGMAPSAVFTEWWRSFEALPSRMRDSGRDRDPAGCEVSRGSPAGKRAHLGSASAEELLTEEPSCEAVDMTAPETFSQLNETLDKGRQWYGPRPPGAAYNRPSTPSRENCHADRSYWFGPGEICLRDSWRRLPWENGPTQDASSPRSYDVFRKPAAVPRRHGGLEWRTLLGEGDF